MDVERGAALVRRTCRMNLVTLQPTVMLRDQITHNVGTLLYLFHILEACLPEAGRSWGYPVDVPADGRLMPLLIERCRLAVCRCTTN